MPTNTRYIKELAGQPMQLTAASFEKLSFDPTVGTVVAFAGDHHDAFAIRTKTHLHRLFYRP